MKKEKKIFLVGVLLAFGLSLVPLSHAQNQQGFPDWYAANMDWVAAGYDTRYYQSDNGATLAWCEAHILQTLNLMYRTDNDTLWLHKLAEHGLAIMNNAKDVPTDTTVYCDSLYSDGFRGWGSSSYSGEYDEYLVWDGHFCTELAEFIRTVYENEALYVQFGARADSLLSFIEQHVIGKWYSIWDQPRVELSQSDQSLNDTYHRWIGGQNLHKIPVNRFAAFGTLLLELCSIAKSPHYSPFNPDYIPWYKQVATEMALELYSRYRYDSGIDAYLWNYSTESNTNDISHSAIDVSFALDCFENGIVFTETDMKRLTHTLTRHLCKNPGDFLKTELWDNFDQTDGTENGRDGYIKKWGLLGSFDPLACGVASGVLRKYAETGNNSNRVYAAGIAALACVNKTAYPIVKIVGFEHREISGDGDQFPDPGEELELYIAIANWGNKTVDTLNVTIDCKDERVNFTKKTIQYYAIGSIDTLLNAENSFIFTVESNVTQGGNIPISLLLQSRGKTRTDSIQISIGPMSLLFVDDDGGTSSEAYYRKNILDSLCFYQYWDVAKCGSPVQYFHEFDKVIWSTGERKNNIFSDIERLEIKNYLDHDGKFILFSQGAENALLGGAAPDSLFFNNYLHAEVNDETEGSIYARLNTVIPEFCPSSFLMLASDSTDSFRAINPAADATSIFSYSFGCGGLYTNSFHHLVYLTFGLEHIQRCDFSHDKMSVKQHIMGKLLDIVDQPATSISSKQNQPYNFSIGSYPNPFNCRTCIQFHLSSGSHVKVEIFNALGQRVEVLTDRQYQSGEHQLYWNPVNKESGLYFCNINTVQGNRVIKLLLLK